MNMATGLYFSDSGSSVFIRAEVGGANQDCTINIGNNINKATNKALESNAVGDVFSSATIFQKWSLF